MTTGMPGNLDPAVPQAAGGKWNARSRSTPLAARGEPMVWLTGGALAVCAIMVVGLLAIVLFGGLRTFWPRPIELVKLVGVGGKPGEVFLGTVVRTDSYTPDPTERACHPWRGEVTTSLRCRTCWGRLPPRAER
jgi:hypothetical protein